jgi:cytochrome c
MRMSTLGICLALSSSLLIPSFAAPVAASEDVSDLLPDADVQKGEKVFKKCKSCHTVEQDGKNRTGPNLFGIIDRPVAAKEGFKYSKALVGYGGEWTLERLDAFLAKPKAEVKGTRMTFGGLKKAADRANLLAFLNTYSETPLSFDAQAAAEAAAEEEPEEPEFGVLFVAPGVEETYYTCSACHSEMIVAQQGLSRDGWLEMFDWMVDEQDLQELEEPDRTIILDYLTEHYGTDRPNFPQPN